MRIVILGYNGLIGSRILDILSKINSFNLICVGRNTIYKPYISSRIKYYEWNFISFKKSSLSFLNKANVIINCVGKTDGNKYDLEYINYIFIKKLLGFLKHQKNRLRLIHLSSIAVYGGSKTFLGEKKIIKENSNLYTNSSYSKSKLKGDLLIQNINKKKLNKNLTFTILRISNVFGGMKESNLFKFCIFFIKLRLWIKSFDDVMFNFINVKDVAKAVILVIFKIKTSKNKIYIVSDDIKQKNLYQNYLGKKKIIDIKIPINLLKFIINFIPIPKKILNLAVTISSRVTYDNQKIKKELKYKPLYSIQKKNK